MSTHLKLAHVTSVAIEYFIPKKSGLCQYTSSTGLKYMQEI